MIRDIARGQMALLIADWANVTPAKVPSSTGRGARRKSRR
jgi:hypothetical protein